MPGTFLSLQISPVGQKKNAVPVGPGRGSGAGSLVAYVLGITDVDPLKYDLLFERFLNPERVSMPDFDIDFCMDNRDRVIDYVAEALWSNACESNYYLWHHGRPRGSKRCRARDGAPLWICRSNCQVDPV